MGQAFNNFSVDGARDDVVAERVMTGAGREVRKLVSQWGATADKRWYPAAWTIQVKYTQGNVDESDDQLQVWTDKGVGVEWFEEPK